MAPIIQLSALCGLFHSIPTNILRHVWYYFSELYKWGNWGSCKLNDLFKITWLVNCRLRVKPNSFWPQVQALPPTMDKGAPIFYILRRRWGSRTKTPVNNSILPMPHLRTICVNVTKSPAYYLSVMGEVIATHWGSQHSLIASVWTLPWKPASSLIAYSAEKHRSSLWSSSIKCASHPGLFSSQPLGQARNLLRLQNPYESRFTIFL